MIGLGGLEITCSPRKPRFVGLNPAEVDEFYKYISAVTRVDKFTKAETDIEVLSTSAPRV